MAEVKNRFAINEKRLQLFTKLEDVISILRECKCPEVHLDGSFISQKEYPGDYDLCYEPTGIVPTESFRLFLKDRKEHKEKYSGDIFIHMPVPPYGLNLIDYWQTDTRNDDVRKGIIRIDLR